MKYLSVKTGEIEMTPRIFQAPDQLNVLASSVMC